MLKPHYLRKKLTYKERFSRDTEILREFNDRLSTHMSIAKIASKHGITSVQVYNIVKNYTKNYEWSKNEVVLTPHKSLINSLTKKSYGKRT